MTRDDAERALSVAKVRGFVVIDEPFDADCAEQQLLLNAWNDHCEATGRHRVLVVQGAFGLWRAAIGFHDGADAEMGYVRREIEDAFLRHLGSGPNKSDEVWYAATQKRRTAEALAFELASIVLEPRDPAFEDVFVVNDL